MKKIIFITFMGLILLMGFVMAADWTPTGNINLRNVYNITNVPYINGTTANFTMYYGNGSQLTGIVATPSPHNDLSGLQGGNISEYYHLNATIWNRIMTYAYSWIYDLSSYYTKTEVNAMNTSVNNYMIVLNTSNNNYIVFTNGTMKSYVDAVNTAINNSNNNYALVLNDSNNNYIVYTNGTMKSYVDSQDIIFNNSVNNYIVSANNTLAGWVDNLFVRFTEIVSQVGNWTLDKVNYYTQTETNAINTSVTNALNTKLGINQWNATNTSYYLASNPSGFYNSSSNIGNWTSDKPSYTLLSVLNNGSYLNYAWNSTNTSYALESVLMNGSFLNYPWNSTNISYYLVTNPAGFFNVTSNIGNWTLDKPSYTLLSVLNNGSYLNYPWNATNTSINWVSLTNYPVACPAGSYVTQIDDSITCTTVVETNWNANYSVFLTHTTQTYVDNQNTSQTNLINLNNVSTTNFITSNNVTLMQIINNGSYFNPATTDTFVANYSVFLTHIDWSKITNGSIWSWVMNGTMSTVAYGDAQNTSQTNYINLQNSSLVNYVGIQNTSMTNWISNVFNVTRNNYVASVNNTLAGWVGGTFNTTINAIMTAQNTSQTNYINFQNTSVTNALATKLGLAGGTMTGNITMAANTNITFNGNSIWSNVTCLQLKGSTVTMLIC